MANVLRNDVREPLTFYLTIKWNYVLEHMINGSKLFQGSAVTSGLDLFLAKKSFVSETRMKQCMQIIYN